MRALAVAVFLAFVAAGCDSEAGFPDARIPDAAPIPGTFSLTWTLTDTVDGGAVTCDDVAATSVTITVREAGAAGGQVEVFNCTSGGATSRPYAPGTYVLTFELRGTDGLIVMGAPRNDVVVTSGADTAIGAVDFAVAATGGFSIQLTAQGVTSNCDAAPAGGAIDALELTFTRDGTCVPITYVVNPPGPGTATTCPATPVACIERDLVIEATGLDSGRYQLGVIGTIGPDACWTVSREIRVPTDGTTASYMVILTYQSTVPGCPPLS